MVGGLNIKPTTVRLTFAQASTFNVRTSVVHEIVGLGAREVLRPKTDSHGRLDPPNMSLTDKG